MNADVPVGAEMQRARNAWHAGLKGDMLAPINYLVQLTDSLLQDAEDANADYVADVRRILSAARELLDHVHAILESAPQKEEPDLGKIRHKLRTPLGQIIGYCEVWLVDEKDRLAELMLERFVADLQELHDLSKQMLARLDDIVNFAHRSVDDDADPDAVHWLEVHRRIILGAHRESLNHKGVLLVVDDSDMNRDLLGRWLRREGHEVVMADNGLSALDMVRQRPFDLILLDILMPGTDGIEVLRQLKSSPHFQHIPVIMISAFGETESVVRCIQMGAEDYLPKPFNRAVLKARIGAGLERKRLVEQIQRERRRSDELLHVIFPATVVRELKAKDMVQPRRFEDVAVMFCDIVGFTPFCDENQPEDVVSRLQVLIEAWEEIALRHHVEKIKTIGDAFMAAAGLLQPTPESPVLHCVRCGLEMIEAVRQLGWNIRVGIHAGPVVAGVIGKRQYLYDLWGDTVNTAARLESHGMPGGVVLSGPAWRKIAHCCRGEALGMIPVKGKKLLEMVRFDAFIEV